jgi:hypothetical protein
MYMHYLLLPFVVATALLSSACAHNAADQQGVANAQTRAQQEEGLDERVRRVLGDAPVVADSSLDPDLMYKFLMAEIAGQRGDIELASDTYLQLARITGDARVARRATEIALYAKRDDVALETARIWYQADPQEWRPALGPAVAR